MSRRNREDRPSVKGHRITVRLDEVEHAAVLRVARGAGLAPSVLLRAAALELATGQQRSTVARPPDETSSGGSPTVDALRVDLKRIGVNLNQLTRLGNRGGYVPVELGEDVTSLHETLREMRDTIAWLLVGLGAVGPKARP